MKIICLGKNYPPAEETPIQEPVIFLKPDSCLLHGGNPFFCPEFSTDITVEAELAVRICRLGKYIEPRFAHKYYDALTVGLDFTAQDLYDKLSSASKPIDIAKGFDGAAAIGRWIAKDTIQEHLLSGDLSFSLYQDQLPAMQGRLGDMLFSIEQAIGIVSRYYTLKTGDILLTGSPAGSIPAKIGTRLDAFLGEENVLSVKIK